ncbi:short-chain dehydrogenase/reductase [Aspergillus sclerotioniger CBS 115572]|uniref:Short-chain dehydrogenase/reductase n=1 Tax=Aspergillus sclerotioniger CBS 115572 TaxID=1450535 RepID=A0A317VG53_9EURO|nr:short-chain dehydrogenase/reductase [Aspergillus sclerotioniger CBS 115572]PWY70810.1 short-chain dehydrogenase/reductase [Aspergillus sclerotioniger CBS 115572]
MASIATVLENNSSITHRYGSDLVAVFVGGTSGIGESTACAFIRNTNASRAYLVGRDQARATQIIEEMRQINPDSQIDFIKSDVSLFREVDNACKAIQQKEDKVNILFLSPGVGTTKGRDETDEGLDRKLNLHYYSRMRFVTNLLPQLIKAGDMSNKPGNSKPCLSRVVSHLAAAYPQISFIHSFPGVVRTRLGRDFGAVTKYALDALMVLARPWEIPLDESGERHLFAATSLRFPPRLYKDGVLDAAEGSDGCMGSGFYRLGSTGSTYRSSKIMGQYRVEGVRGSIWKHTLDVFAMVRGAQVEL